MDELFYRDTGRLFTGLCGNLKSIVNDDNIERFESESDEKIALWKQPKHKKYREIADKRIRRIKKGGRLIIKL
jgi:uncharacterized protein YehS (DUF1456 family)